MKLQTSKIFITITTALILITVQLLTAAVCFAEDLQYIAIRSDRAFMQVPETWTSEEYGDLHSDRDSINDGQPAYELMELSDENGDKQAETWVYADVGNVDANYYCSSEEAAAEYYEEDGYTYLCEILDEALPYAQPDEDTLEYIDSGYTYFIRINTEYEGDDYLTYLSCEDTQKGILHIVTIFEPTVDQALCDQIGTSLEAFTYASELIDEGSFNMNSPDPELFDDEGFGSEPFHFVLNAGLVLVLFLAAVKLLKAGAKRARQENRAALGLPPKPDTSSTNPFAKASAKAAKAAKAKAPITDKWVRRNTKPLHKDHPQHDDCQATGGGRYSGYQESLKTLHKSGLLTTKEMNELLEKHKDDF